MKSLELTQKHKAKLIEMCKGLYPKNYKFQFLANTNEMRIVETNNHAFIHWFEFCSIHLLKRLAEKLAQHFEYYSYNLEREEWLAEDIEAETLEIIREYHRVISHSLIFWGSLNNPIDYLYDLFKQLK